MKINRNLKGLLKLSLILVIATSNLITSVSALAHQTIISGLGMTVLDKGIPPFKVFSSKEFAANVQNWAIEQAPNGMIYIGNTDGILEFDGVRWRLIPVSNGTIVRSLSVDPESGRIYVGAVGEIGFLEPDSRGKMQYVSLLPLLDKSQTDFADVWQSFVTSEGVFFSSFKRLIRIKGNSVSSWEPETSFHFSFQVGGRLLIREVGKGLLELINGQLELISQGDQFANERIYGIISLNEIDPNGLLIITRSDGLFLHQNNVISRFTTQVDKALKQSLLYAAAWLPDGRIALCTLQNGLYILDNKGNLLKTLNRASGFPDNTVTAIKADKDNGIWLTLTNGIVRIEANMAISYFNEQTGLNSSAYTAKEFNQSLYVGASFGLYKLVPGPGARFNQVEGVQNQIHDILEVKNRLLLANYLGVYQILDDKAELIFPFDAVSSFHLDSVNKSDKKGKVFVGLRDGVRVIYLKDEQWIDDGLIPGINGEIRNILQLTDGTLWLGTYTTGIIRVVFGADDVPVVTYYGEADGLPSLIGSSAQEFDGKLIFLTKNGIYEFIEETQSFALDPRFDNIFGDNNHRILDIEDDPAHGLWLLTKDEQARIYHLGLAVKTSNGKYLWQPKILHGISDFATSSILRDTKGVLWLTGDEGLLRFDPNLQQKMPQGFEVLIRQVSQGDGNVLFSGAGNSVSPVLAFGKNRLRFEFAALSFDGMGEHLYQVKLDGADDKWSSWSDETFKDYSNLWEGKYQLYVKAKNRQGVIAQSQVYTFTILPPWYRSLLAYSCYLFIVAGSIWLTMRWRLGILQTQKHQLRSQVDKRTADILMLSEIGRDLTSTLNFKHVIEEVYKSLNKVLDSHVFLLGTVDIENNRLNIPFMVENQEEMEPWALSLDDLSRPGVWCVKHQKEVIIQNESDRINYPQIVKQSAVMGNSMETIVYQPLILDEKIIGCLSIQSPQKNAYNEKQLEMIRTLSSYTAIAVANSLGYEKMEQMNHQLEAKQAELMEARDEARFATKSKSDFLANMSHEIRTPMHGIIGLTKLVQNTVLDSEQSNYVDKIDFSANNLLFIVNEIMDFSKVEAGKMELESVPLSLTELMSNLNSLVGTLAKDKKLVFDYSIDPKVPVDLIGDPVRISQVLTNLCSNAVKFTETGKVSVLVKLISSDIEQKNIAISFEVLDEGIGIPKDVFDSLFDSFSQADESTTRKFGGTGLGLAISKKLAQLMNGDITVASTVGEGSCFTFTALLNPFDFENSSQIIPEKYNKPYQFLLCSKELSSYFYQNMARMEACLTVANSSHEAIKLLEEKNDYFDLMIVDWEDVDGRSTDFLNDLHELDLVSKTKLVVASDIKFIEAKKRVGKYDVQEIINKPISIISLYKQVVPLLFSETETDKELASLSGVKLLVVEDNKINQIIAERFLLKYEGTVVLASNGVEALEQLELQEFDIILMDIFMPEMGGLEAAKNIRSQAKFDTLPILAMTANVMSSDIESYLEAGMDGCITKPFDTSVMLQKIKDVISSNRLK